MSKQELLDLELEIAEAKLDLLEKEAELKMLELELVSYSGSLSAYYKYDGFDRDPDDSDYYPVAW